MLSYCRNIFGYLISPIVLFVISLSIASVSYFIGIKIKSEKSDILFSVPNKYSYIAVSLFVITFLVFLVVPRGGIINLFRNFLTDPKYSDIIPTIQTMCHRLLNNEQIYVSIEKFGYHLPTTYLPFMWLPYTISAYFHFDYRWITLLIGILVIAFTFLFTIESKAGILFSFLYGFFLFSLIEKNADILGWSVELMNGAYYTILGLSFFSNNKYVKAIALSICILSRYSLVVFLPLYFIIEYSTNGWKRTCYFVVITFLIVATFLVPLVGKNWVELYNGYKYYSTSGVGEWLHTNEQGLPIHILNGNGFVSWIYSFKSGTVEERFVFAKSLHMIMVFATTISLTALYFKLKDKLNNTVFLLCSFKVYLAVFYGFIQVPYTYLFVVPLMYSLVMLMILNKKYLSNSNRNYVND